MADYSEGKIYLVKFRNDPSLVYVGSTKRPLDIRFRKHKNDKKLTSLKNYINDNHDGNWDGWYIELYEDYPCLNKKELERREGEVILKFKNDNTYNCINKYIAGRTMKEYYEDNKDKILEKAKEYKKKYNEQNKEKINEKAKEYNEQNKEKIKEKRKEKFTCSCGSICGIGDKARHLKTQKHLASL